MPLIHQKSTLPHLTVGESMGHQVVRVPGDSPLDRAVGRFIKHKGNALLVIDNADPPAGVLSLPDAARLPPRLRQQPRQGRRRLRRLIPLDIPWHNSIVTDGFGKTVNRIE